MNKAIRSSDTRFVFLNQKQPVCKSGDASMLQLLQIQGKQLSSDFRELIENWGALNEERSRKIMSLPLITYLGLDSTESSGFEYTKGTEVYRGTPCFAVDISGHQALKQELENYLKAADICLYNVSETPTTINPFDHMMLLNNEDASLFSQAMMYIDWLQKNTYCSGCGGANIIINGGTQVSCTTGELCVVSGNAPSNVSYPRTDIATISSVTNHDYSKILLVKNKRYPLQNLYSCVAGFLEPSETIETCVAREIWEETNVKIKNGAGDVRVLTSQPWPYPATLMLGCCGEVDVDEANSVIKLNHDDELNDARWFDVDLVREMITEYETIGENLERAQKHADTKLIEQYSKQRDELFKRTIMLPMRQTIAYDLIKRIVCMK